MSIANSYFVLQVIKDSKLFMILGLLMLVDFIILCSWEISDPVRRQTRELMPEVKHGMCT